MHLPDGAPSRENVFVAARRLQRRRPPPVAETGRSCWGSGQQDVSAVQGTKRMLGTATRRQTRNINKIQLKRSERSGDNSKSCTFPSLLRSKAHSNKDTTNKKGAAEPCYGYCGSQFNLGSSITSPCLQLQQRSRQHASPGLRPSGSG